MNKRTAKAEACFLATLWIHSAIDEGCFATRIEELGSEADGERLQVAMDELLGELERRSTKCIPASEVHR